MKRVIRQRGYLQYKIIEELETKHNGNGIFSNQIKIKSFWGTTEMAVRVQIFIAITAYCMGAIVEHDLQLHRCTYEVLGILSASLLDKTPIKDFFANESVCDTNDVN